MKFPKSAANAISICFDNPFLSKDVTKTFSQGGTHKPKKENMRSSILKVGYKTRIAILLVSVCVAPL